MAEKARNRAEAEERKGDARRRPSIVQWSAKPESAAKHYGSAAQTLQQLKETSRALTLLEKQAEALSESGDSFSSGRTFEHAVSLARTIPEETRVHDLAIRASEAYSQCNKAHAGAFALQRAAPALSNDAARAKLYGQAADLMVQEDRVHESLEPRRQEAASYASDGHTSKCVHALLQLGSDAEQCQSPHQQAQAYLSAIVTQLHDGDASGALATLGDAREVEAFESSQQCGAAIGVLEAYKTSRNRDDIRKAVRAYPSFRHLEQAFARMALALPTDEMQLERMASSLSASAQGEEHHRSAAEELEEPAEEEGRKDTEDLT